MKRKVRGTLRDAQLCFSANESWSFYYSLLVSKPQARSDSVGNVGHVAQKKKWAGRGKGEEWQEVWELPAKPHHRTQFVDQTAFYLIIHVYKIVSNHNRKDTNVHQFDLCTLSLYAVCIIPFINSRCCRSSGEVDIDQLVFRSTPPIWDFSSKKKKPTKKNKNWVNNNGKKRQQIVKSLCDWLWTHESRLVHLCFIMANLANSIRRNRK